VYERNAGRRFTPASNLKLVVTSTAAHQLPATYRYRTTVYGTGPVQGGVLHGDLVLYGRGDPLIDDRYGHRAADAWEELADSLLARGIHAVDGAVVGDDSYFEALHIHPDWKPSDLRWWYAAPVGALGYNDNAVQVRVEPGAVGERARLRVAPETGYVDLENRTVTVGGRGEALADMAMVPGTTRIRVTGLIPGGAGPDVEFVAVRDGAEYAATTFREVLEQKGIAIGARGVRVVRDPAQSPARGATVLAEHWSDPLDHVIEPILLNSQNWFAETLLKTLGREARGEGSWTAGLAVERAFLRDVVGIDTTEFVLRDGSGLSANNQVTPRALARLLAYVQRAPEMGVVRDHLPVAGLLGTLKDRMRDLAGRVHAKTGYIGGVESLSGYVTADDGRTLIFSIIANGGQASSGTMKSGIDDVVRAIAATPAS
jgi:D-alanyl-D-alanine carboxypeptidase/D-alanyl-D-alanine-endopeptidase (penicillin-binding protein 4)